MKKRDKEEKLKLKLKQIWNNYTYENQTRKLAEEQYELVEQLIKANCYLEQSSLWKTGIVSETADKIVSEIADNYVLIKQFMLEFQISDKEVLEEANKKIDRQLKRIEIENLTK